MRHFTSSNPVNAAANSLPLSTVDLSSTGTVIETDVSVEEGRLDPDGKLHTRDESLSDRYDR